MNILINKLLRLLIGLSLKAGNFFSHALLKFPPTIITVDIHGVKFKLNTKDIDGLTKILMMPNNQWEANETKAFIALSKFSDVTFDIGSNIGVYAILAATANPTSKIFSFEPNPTNVKKLKKNIAVNKITNIQVIEKAIGDRNCSLNFYLPSSTNPSSVSSFDKNYTSIWHKDVVEIQVSQITIDNFVKDTDNISQINLIKIDIENYELNALLGSKEIICKYKPAILMEVHLKEVLMEEFPKLNGDVNYDHSIAIESFFKELNYNFYAIGTNGLLRINSFYSHPDARNFVLSSYNSTNMYIPYSNPDLKFIIQSK